MKYLKLLLLSVVILFANRVQQTQSFKIKFSNFKCEEFDKSFLTIRKCGLKAVSRNTVRLNLHVQLHQLPINNITAHYQLFAKSNGYKPFLFNNTLDFCRFLENSNGVPFWKAVFEEIRPYTNVNHTCPIVDDVIVNDLVLNGEMFKMIPFPKNDYMIQMQFAVNKHYKLRIKAFINIHQ